MTIFLTFAALSNSAIKKTFHLHFKILAVQRLMKLEEQYIHHFNLIKYLVPITMSILWITSFGKLMESLKGNKL